VDGRAIAPPAASAPVRLARTWADPRGEVRREIAAASEARLFVYALIASLVVTAGTLAAGRIAPSPAIAADPDGWAAATLIGGGLVRPAALYLVAWLLAAICRAFGGAGDGRATRAAVFWTSLAAAPATFALGLTGAAWGLPALSGLGSVAWALILAPALAEAQGFRRAWLVLAALGAFGALAILASLI
jgi:hypothetical protein